MITADDSTDKPAPAGFREVTISREPVELFKILKFENLAGSGAEAKAAVASGQVLINGKIETRKRKQIVAGDTIEFGADKIIISLSASPPVPAPTVIKAKPATKKMSAARKPVQISKGKTPKKTR